MSPIGLTALVVACAMALFVWNRLPVVVVAIGTALGLFATGVLTLEQALAGFGDPAVTFIASLFVVSAALESTGVTAWVGQKLVAKSGGAGPGRMLATLMLLVAALTALISANGAVAALLPVASVAALRMKLAPSQVLMPLAFAAHAGANLVLTGSPKNVLISEAVFEAGYPAFGFFEFALAGIPLVIGTVIIVLLFGSRLLPTRRSPSIPADLSQHARTLVEQYGLKAGVFRLRVRPSSGLVGRIPGEAAPPSGANLQVVAWQDGDGAPLGARPIAAGDVLVARGDPDATAAFAQEFHLAFRDDELGQDAFFNTKAGLAEVIIPPRSALVGRTVFPGMISEDGDLAVLAVQRRGEDLPEGEAALEVGDTLLLQGAWKALDLRLGDPDVLLVNSPDLVRRQALPLGPGAFVALAALGVMVVLLATGLTPPVIAGLTGAGVLLVSGVMSVDAAYRAVNWTTVILVGAMMPLSVAMEQTGAARLLADSLVAALGGSGPIALLAGLFMLTALLGQIMSNTATTLIVIPIAIAAAEGMGVSPRPVLMSVCVAGAAAFLTPIATSTNLMVMGPGGYRFGDYWRLGLPLLAWYFLVATFYVPLVWRF